MKYSEHYLQGKTSLETRTVSKRHDQAVAAWPKPEEKDEDIAGRSAL
jgi:hypothetical protein